MIMKMKRSRRKFLKRLGAMGGAVLVPGLAAEHALAIPITTTGAATKKKAAPKRKVATKKKAAPKRKVATKKKAAPKRKVATKKKTPTYSYKPPYKRPPHKSPASIPEPSTVGLVSIGVAAIALATRHKKKKR